MVAAGHYVACPLKNVVFLGSCAEMSISLSTAEISTEVAIDPPLS